MPARRQSWEHGTVFGYDKRGCRCEGCRRARKEYDRERYERLRDLRAEQNREWRAANPDKVRATSKRQYYRDLEKSRERNREYAARRPEMARARKARYMATEKGRLKNVREQHKRRGVITDEWTNEYIAILLKDLCSYCGGPGGTVDHIVPVSKGGTSEWHNLTAACLSCNSSKHNSDLIGFLSRKAS